MIGTSVNIGNFKKLFVELTPLFIRRKLKYDTLFLSSSSFRGYVTPVCNNYLKYLNNNKKKVLPVKIFNKYSTNIHNPSVEQ